MTTTVPRMPASTGRRAAPDPLDRLRRIQHVLVAWLAAYSVTALRISLGLVITAFGALKFVPGASPAAALAAQT
ncbi:MAG: DoxX family protein, partial [Actinomycetia bacterium]|nr:DoxX family protein [Actinomycetes bacterium]